MANPGHTKYSRKIKSDYIEFIRSDTPNKIFYISKNQIRNL